MKNNISIVIHTHNEASSIKECIQSANLLTSDVLVIDMESTDETQTIVKSMGVRMLTFPFSQFVEPARSFGITNSLGSWVFILDADERMTKELAEDIHTHIETGNHSHYKTPRQNIFGRKKWLQHGGWWPDFQMRLIKRDAFRDWPSRIHSTPHIEGTLGYLEKPLLHYFHGDIEKMLKKTIVFESIESDLLSKAHKSSNTQIFFRKFFGELYRRLFKNQGYKDGILGIIESVYQAFSKTITYLLLYEKKISSSL